MRVGMLEAPGSLFPSPDSPLLEARRVGETAERDILSLALPRNEAFEALYSYLTVDEPAVHLMPVHFLPRSSRGVVERRFLLPLGVAAKLEYVRSRWIDEIVDQGSVAASPDVYRLHDAVVDLIMARYSEVLRGRGRSVFFRTLIALYARHAVSVAVDGSRPASRVSALGEEEYSAQVRARNGSFRASVDAVMMLAGAPERLLQRARECWHSWVLGAQLYDDALDVEEDYGANHLTWAVARTLTGLHESEGGDHRPDRDRFYEAALTGGALTETLEWAESCFENAARLAEIEFPSWAALQRACITQTSRLRGDLQQLTTEAAEGKDGRETSRPSPRGGVGVRGSL